MLAVRDLSAWIGGSHILQGVTFDVAGSGVTALLGRNGVGKTSTLRAILGELPATGSVVFGGEEVLGRRTHRLVRSGLGYAPEDRCVFAGLSVAENLRLACRVPDPDYDTVYALFPELRNRARQRAGTLSGGQQQMVAIGRLLLNPNRLLLVDEPTKGLAPKVVAEVAGVLERVAARVPILLVEQNLAVVRRLAGAAVVLAAGRVAWQGRAADLLGDADRTRSLLGVGTSVGHRRPPRPPAARVPAASGRSEAESAVRRPTESGH